MSHIVECSVLTVGVASPIAFLTNQLMPWRTSMGSRLSLSVLFITKWPLRFVQLISGGEAMVGSVSELRIDVLFRLALLMLVLRSLADSLYTWMMERYSRLLYPGGRRMCVSISNRTSRGCWL